MITRSFKGLCMLLALFVAVGTSVQAQIKTTSFNDNLVKENSIVVKFDNTMITAKGKAVSPKTLAADVRTQFNASIGRTIEATNVEEWIVAGDMNAVLNQLNRIPGVRAFPNYVFYRDEMEVTPIDFSDQVKFNEVGENRFPSLQTMYGDEVLINGAFSDSLANWTTYNADFAGVFADFSAADSVARVTNITGPNDEVWFIQLFQELSMEQLDALNMGGLYELTFDASTDSASKDLNVFVGQNSGDFLSHVSEFVTLTPGDSTYTFQFYMWDVWYDEGMKVAFEGGLSDASIYVDNVSLRQANSPVSAVDAPALADSLVISIYSDDYTNVPVDTYRTDWSVADFRIDSVDGNQFIAYENLDFVGIETVANQIDATDMTHFYFNVWTPNADVMRVKLVDFGADGAFGGGDDTEHEVVFDNFPKSAWLQANIPLYAFEGLDSESNIAQIIFSAAPAGQSTLFIDNVLFWDDGSVTSDPLLSLQYGLNNDGSFNPGYSQEGADVDAFAAWEHTTGSDEVVMVVYDDGVDFSHPDLYDNRWVNSGEDIDGDGVITDADWNGIDDDGNGYPDDFWGWSSVYNDNSFLNPGSFHGTHVAGILGAQGDNGIGISGVAQDVTLINVMIFNEFGGTDAFAILGGYQYISDLLDAGVPVTGINQSWGGGEPLDFEGSQQFLSVMTDYALDHAEHAALWIVSAGNDASNRDELPYYSFPNNIQSPNLITVASSDDADNLSGFSDYGTFTVDVTAPGSSVYSTLPPSTTGVEYGFLSGTSMAAPHVAGILALAKAMYPTEDGFDLMTRLLAGNEDVSSLNGLTGAGGRVNALGALDPTEMGAGTPFAGGNTNQFHRTFVDGDALETSGIVNTSDSDLDITGLNITGPNADNFYLITEDLPTLAPGEAFGILVGFNNDGLIGDLTATLEVATSQGVASLGLVGHEQGFAFVAVDPDYANLGAVPYGEELSTTFNVFNLGNTTMYYDIGQALFFYDLEFSQFVDSQVSFQAGPAPAKEALDINQTEFFDDLTAKVMLDRGDRKLPKIEYVPGSHRESDLLGAEEVWFDDLNDEEETLANWDLQSFGANEAYFDLYDVTDVEGDTNNVFLFGDFDFGYPESAVPVAITPSFDFSALEAGRAPAYLAFDVEAELEDGWDDFYINVISNGSRLATIAGTFNGTIVNFGGYYRAFIDISQFAGNDDIEFWFIANTDASFAAGFGVLFDNVSVVVDDAPFFTTVSGGEVEPGESEEVEVIVRTELLPAGDWILYTDVFANGFASVYGNGGDYASHITEFSARNVALEVSPMEDWIGEASTEEATEFSFDATNVGTVDVEVFTDVFIAYNQPDDFMGEPFIAGKESALERFANADKEEGNAPNLIAQQEFITKNLDKRTGVTGTINRVADAPRMSPSRENLDIYFEDFEGFGEEVNFYDVWSVSDGSPFGLGSVFDVVNYGSEEAPDNFLNVGGVNENGWYILDNTFTLAFSESFDLSEIPLNEGTIFEFTYSFLLEPGYDFGSVWVGVNGEFGTELYYLGGSDDVLFNNGGFYRSGFDISFLNGNDDVFLAFLVESDQSVQSAWAAFNDLDVYTSEKLAYISPAEAVIDSGATATFDVTVNTPWLTPGDYVAISVLDYYGGNENLFVQRTAEQFTYFEIPNMAPVAEDDWFAAITDEVIPFDAILGSMLANDFDPEGGWLYLYDVEEPLYGDVRYTFDGMMYVAPEEGGKTDMMRYIITDGQMMDTATVYIEIGDNPHFPVGADKQYVFLEDEALEMSTIGMAAGVGFWEDVMVWADSHDDGVYVDVGEEAHSIVFSADENLFGQFTATLYVGTDDGSVWDSTDVSIIVTPVNDAPIADFGTTIDGSTVEFADLSSDALDMNAGGIVAWAWEFGDGNTSNEASPVYDYGTTGDFTVTLTVTDNGGLTNTITGPVEIVSVSNEVLGGVPTEFAIQQNYPNPFNPSTNINYSLPEASSVTIVVYDLLGQRVAELVNTEKAAGYHTVAFDASALSSGVYIYQIQAGAFTQTKKMMLIK